MRSDKDTLDRLAAADPRPGAESLDPDERRAADALLARLVAEPVDAPVRRARPRRLAVAVAATAVALAVLLTGVNLLDDDPPGPDIVARAVAAVTAEDAVFHVVELARFRSPDPPRRRDVFFESWYASDGSQHRKIFAVRGERRGRLLHEVAARVRPAGRDRISATTQTYDARTNTLTHGRYRGRSGRRAYDLELDPARDPAEKMRELERDGRLRLAGTTRVDGKEGYRLVSGPVPGFVKGAVERWEYVVDARTYYPLRVHYAVDTGGLEFEINARYLVYERLPLDAEGRELLRMDPHPGARMEHEQRDEVSGGGRGSPDREPRE